MPGINKIAPKISLMKKISVMRIQRQLEKQGFSDIATRMSKNGTIGIIGTKADGFTKNAHIIKPDGTQFLKEYRLVSTNYTPREFFNRIIKTWQIDKKQRIFVSQSTLYYEGFKVPKAIRTLNADIGCDGTEPILKFPLDKYGEYLYKKLANPQAH